MACDHAVIGDFLGLGTDHAAVSQFDQYFIIDVDRDLIFTPSIDCVWGWPVAIGSADKLMAGHFDRPATYEDVVVWRGASATWEVYLNSAFKIPPAPQGTIQFGLPGDLPATGDFDRDGRADLIVFRPSNGNVSVVLSIDGGCPGGRVRTGRYLSRVRTETGALDSR